MVMGFGCLDFEQILPDLVYQSVQLCVCLRFFFQEPCRRRGRGEGIFEIYLARIYLTILNLVLDIQSFSEVTGKEVLSFFEFFIVKT